MRFGLVGTGAWPRDTHAAGIQAAEGAELVGMWGRDPAKAQAVAREVGVRAYADVALVLQTRALAAGRGVLGMIER